VDAIQPWTNARESRTYIRKACRDYASFPGHREADDKRPGEQDVLYPQNPYLCIDKTWFIYNASEQPLPGVFYFWQKKRENRRYANIIPKTSDE